MRFQLTTRDLFWLMLVTAMGCALLVNADDAVRQIVAVVVIIGVICWFIAAV